MLFKKQRLGLLFAGSILGLIVSMLLATVWTSYHFAVRIMVSNTTAYQERILEEVSGKLQAKFNAIESISLAVTRNSDLLDSFYIQEDRYSDLELMNNIKSAFLNMIFSTPDIDSIQIYWDSPRAYVDRDAVQFLPLASLKEEEWAASVENAESVWLGKRTMPSTLGGEIEALGFARKLYDKGDNYKGVVLINVKASSIESLLQSESGSNVMLTDAGGREILSVGALRIENTDKLLQRIDLERSQPKRYFEGGESEFGFRSLIVWSDSVYPEWMLVQITPWSEINEGGRQLVAALLVIGGVLIGVALVVVLLLKKQFTGPIHALVKQMQRYPREPEPSFVAYSGEYENEFGQMFKGYRQLISRIEELYSSLEKQHDRRRIAEIKALQAMINPHFLYNTLDQINWMAIAAEQEKISSVLELTGRMLRIGLSNGNSLIPLEEEVEHVRCYLEIQSLMRPGLHYRIEGLPAETSELSGWLVPKLILQPFVENSIKHGLYNRAEGEVALLFRVADGRIAIQIRDNGRGFPESGFESKPKARGGYGIRNVKERLETFFGDDYELRIGNLPEGGALVSLLLPLDTKEDVRHVENGYH